MNKLNNQFYKEIEVSVKYAKRVCFFLLKKISVLYYGFLKVSWKETGYLIVITIKICFTLCQIISYIIWCNFLENLVIYILQKSRRLWEAKWRYWNHVACCGSLPKPKPYVFIFIPPTLLLISQIEKYPK